MNLNKVMLYGNLTRDPELKQTQSGSSVCSFSIATNRAWNDKQGQKQQDTQYHKIIAWGRVGELVAQYMKKGSSLLVEGRLQTRNYEAKDGTKRYVTEVVAENIQFGPRKADSGRDDAGYEESHPPAQAAPKEDEIMVDDIPF